MPLSNGYKFLMTLCKLFVVILLRLCSRLTALWRYINFVLLLLLLLLGLYCFDFI